MARTNDDDLDWASELAGTSARKGGGGGAPAGGDRKRGGRSFLLFLLGIAVGAAGAIWLPDLVGPRLPAGLGGGGEVVEGPVLAKKREDQRLLLTVDTGKGAMLASFTARVPEIDLLVGEGDTVSLGVSRYRPFVEDPSFEGVRKVPVPAGARRDLPPAAIEGPTSRVGDTIGARDTARARDTVGAVDTSGAGDTVGGGEGSGAADSISAGAAASPDSGGVR